MSAEAAVVLDGLGVRFGGVVALHGVSLSVPRASLYGIIGPNGSGKTTMINALCGFVRASGTMRLLGRSLAGVAPHRRVDMGLGRTFQNPRVGDDLTVRDLLRIGAYRHGVRPFWQEALRPWRAAAEAAAFDARARRLLNELGLALPDLDAPVASLAHGVVKVLDLARALMSEPSVVLLDELTSGLNEAEIAVMRAQLRRLRDQALTIVIVEHNVRFLTDVCDEVTVLDAGRDIAAGRIQDVLRLPAVIEAYMGEDTAAP
jgi:ABC-type branched-subunit amino acid transport system ATPase component